MQVTFATGSQYAIGDNALKYAIGDMLWQGRDDDTNASVSLAWSRSADRKTSVCWVRAAPPDFARIHSIESAQAKIEELPS